MVRFGIPELLQEYFRFCAISEISKNTDVINLYSYKWFYPTSLLPLSNFIIENIESMEYIPPENSSANSYISCIMSHNYLEGSTYLPMIYLPEDQNLASRIIDKIHLLHNNGKDYGGANAFGFLIKELIDNIYQHAEFTKACVMAQRYERHGFVEIAIFDNGISIPSCFEKHGIHLENDSLTLIKAVNGTSTKNDKRGYGLNSTANIYVNGIGGQMLMVSRNGALFINRLTQKNYILRDTERLDGTLISLRIPYPVTQVNIYPYLEG